MRKDQLMVTAKGKMAFNYEADIKAAYNFLEKEMRAAILEKKLLQNET